MSWCAVDVRSPESDRGRVARWLVDRTGQAVEERADGVLVGFSESERGATELLAELSAEFGGSVTGLARAVAPVNWDERWRDGLGPRRIGRLTVTPSWTSQGLDPSLTVIVDPETAFGTGEHGSTRAALTLLDRHLVPGGFLLDLGSGSGILTIGALKLGAARAAGIDHDPEAEPIALANAQRNGVSERATFLTGDAAALAPLLGPAGAVVSNILRLVNVALLPAIRAALAPGGLAVFSGMEHSERELFLPELARAGFRVTDEVVDEGWWGACTRC